MPLKDWNLEASEEEITLSFMNCKHEFKHKFYNKIYCSFCGKLIVERTIEHFEEESVYRAEKARPLIMTGTYCNLSIDDPNFNSGKGNKFYKAFDIAIKRGDFK